jgi:selenocysteine lyase/cysteine desulfurase
VLTAQREFTSVTFPFAAQSARRVTIDEVDIRQLPDRAAEYGIVAVSAVQSVDGAVVDLPALRAAVSDTDTRVVLDVTQAAGWLPLDLGWVDVVVCTGYKWLMSPRGAAWMAVRPDYAEELVPTAANWYAGESRWDTVYGLPLRLAADNRRFDASPAWFSQLGAAAVLPQLAKVDRDLIYRHCVSLADAFRAEFDLPAAGSAIVSIEVPDAAERLARAGVIAAVRAGASRLSFHLYNNANDLDQAVAALR